MAVDPIGYLADVLKPIKVVVWGERAMTYLGVGIVYNSFMFVPADDDFSAAVEKFEKAGFRRTSWSYATRDPDLLGTDPHTLRIYNSRIREYERFDQHSVRFDFPSSFNLREKVVLLWSSYVHLSPPSAAEIATAAHPSAQQSFVHGNLYYPDKVVLLESFIRVALKEEQEGEGLYNWSELLGA